MIFNYPDLKRNYQRVSTNRFVVDSDRFWKKQFNPRFKDIFTKEQFLETFEKANNMLSFKLSDDFIKTLSENFLTYLSGFRFACIPSKNPETVQMFISDLLFILMDILPQVQFKNFPLDKDDFNVVSNRGETAKTDSTQGGITENNLSGNENIISGDILSRSDLRNENKVNGKINTNSDLKNETKTTATAAITTDLNNENIINGKINTNSDIKNENKNSAGFENTDDVKNENKKLDTNTDSVKNSVQLTTNETDTDDKTNKNSRSVDDVFLSPQNQGVSASTQNIKYNGVDGLPVSGVSGYLTNKKMSNLGESIEDIIHTKSTDEIITDENIDTNIKTTEVNTNNDTQKKNNANTENSLYSGLQENAEQSTDSISGSGMQENAEQSTDSISGSDLQENAEQSTDSISGSELSQNNDIRTQAKNNSDLQLENSLNVSNVKTDNYSENLEFDRAKKLQEFYNIVSDSLINMIIIRLFAWILQVDIATADNNYNNLPIYE